MLVRICGAVVGTEIHSFVDLCFPKGADHG